MLWLIPISNELLRDSIQADKFVLNELLGGIAEAEDIIMDPLVLEGAINRLVLLAWRNQDWYRKAWLVIYLGQPLVTYYV